MVSFACGQLLSRLQTPFKNQQIFMHTRLVACDRCSHVAAACNSWRTPPLNLAPRQMHTAPFTPNARRPTMWTSALNLICGSRSARVPLVRPFWWSTRTPNSSTFSNASDWPSRRTGSATAPSKSGTWCVGATKAAGRSWRAERDMQARGGVPFPQPAISSAAPRGHEGLLPTASAHAPHSAMECTCQTTWSAHAKPMQLELAKTTQLGSRHTTGFLSLICGKFRVSCAALCPGPLALTRSNLHRTCFRCPNFSTPTLCLTLPAGSLRDTQSTS